MKDIVKTYKTDSKVAHRIDHHLKALKDAGIGDTVDERYYLGLFCLCETKGIVV